jgi:hypothetical protein
MNRNKTQRKKPSTPAPEGAVGPFQGDNAAKATEDSLNAFLAEDERMFYQPWQKLDRGARLDRLRKFVQQYPGLGEAEAASLLSVVLQAYEKKQLNTKLAVEYDPVNAKVLGIRGLKERVGLHGIRTFRIEAAVRATIKRAKSVQPGLNTASTN